MATLGEAHEEKIESANGFKIFVRSWSPESKPRAVVVICHGVNSHGGQYTWVARQFAAVGLAAYADGERFYVEDVAE
jgi:acylglycerol lipase